MKAVDLDIMFSENFPLVSIVTPAFNASRFIGKTIASIQAQTYENWELIVVDDCSFDDTCELVEQIARDDSRIRLIRHSTNGGPAKARNTALESARGSFIAFLDSDDLWLPTKLEKQLTFMLKLNVVFSYTQYRRISDTGEKVGRIISIPSTLNYHDLLKNTAIVTSSVLIDKRKVGSFRMEETYYDDFALWLDILRRGFTAYGLQEDLVRYRVVGKSVSRNKIKSAMWVWRTYRSIEKLNIIYAGWCFFNYAWNALKKYRKF